MPAIAAVAAVWGAIGSIPVVGAMIQSAIISAAVGAAAQKLGEQQADQAAEDYGAKVNTTNNTAPLMVTYGRRVLGGNEARFTSGQSNRYLHRVMVIGEGEIGGVDEVQFNGKDVDDPANGYSSLVSYDIRTGTEGQAAVDDLVSRVDDWGVDHRGYGVAYVHVRTEWDRDVFETGVPLLTVKIRGIKVYDPRTGLTEWSDNPALCLRDYLTNARYGVGIPESFVDDAAFIEAANYCDELVTFRAPEGQEYNAPRYTCNGTLNPDNGALENTRRLLTACRGMLVFTGGKYELIIDKPEVSSFPFNEDNITGSWSFSGSSKRSLANQVRARFFDSARNWEDSMSVTKAGAYIDEDRQLFEQDVFYPLTDELARVDILAQHHLKQSRQGLKASFTTTLGGLGAKAGRVVEITHATPGWEAKLFRVLSIEPESNDLVRVTVGEYDPSVYTFDVLQPPVIPDTALPDPFSAPPPSGLSLASGEEYLQVAPDGTLISRMLAWWITPPSSMVDRYEVGYKLSINTGWTSIETSEVQHFFVPVVDGHLYDVRVRAVYHSGRRSEWVVRTDYRVEGKTGKPAAPPSFSLELQRDHTRQFSWELNTTDLDAKGYVIRYSTDLAAEWEAMFTLHDGLLLSSPWETNLLNAGTYRFAIKTIDTSGNESAAARYMTATLSDSPTSSIFYARYPRQEGWPGTLEGYISTANDLESNDPTEFDDVDLEFDEMELWGQNGDPLIYQFEDIDLGTILTFRPVVSVQAQGNVTYEVSVSDDGAVWTGWSVPAADITGRYLRVRVTVVHQEARINSMSIMLDGAQKEEELVDVDTAALPVSHRIGPGDIRLPVQQNFTTVRTVLPALHGTGPGWSWEIFDKTDPIGPRIRIYDNTGTLADATLDAIIKGY